MEKKKQRWGLTLFFSIVSLPILILYAWLFIDTISEINIDSIWPNKFTLKNWQFLFTTIKGHSNIWPVAFNTLVYAISTVIIVLTLSSTSGYALSRLKVPFRAQILGTVLVLHSFPSVTLIIAIFIILRALGLYDTLFGIILVTSSLQLPLGIWVMKGFYDNVPWEIEMAGILDGASRFQVWYKLVLPQIKPGIAALSIFSFMAGWGEYILPLILTPSSDREMLSVFLSGLLIDDYLTDYGLFKAVGLFYILPVLIFYLFTQDKLSHIYRTAIKK